MRVACPYGRRTAATSSCYTIYQRNRRSGVSMRSTPFAGASVTIIAVAILLSPKTVCVARASSAPRSAGSEALRRDFTNPPIGARPRVWWHWMNGNVTQEGIRRDLEWTHRIGLGRVQTFDASFDTPQLVTERLEFMTSPWKEAFRSATILADRLGLEFAIASAPGWSESGGPWVKPEEAMKKIVWMESRLRGGVRFEGRLPDPPHNIGPFQDIPVTWGLHSPTGPAPPQANPSFYRDIAVIAYRLPDADQSMAELRPAVTSSAGALDTSLLWDGYLNRSIHLPYGKNGEPSWILVDFGHPQLI